MFDINEAINAAITKAVNEQLEQMRRDLINGLDVLTERIECLDQATGARLNNAELNLTAMADQGTALAVRINKMEVGQNQAINETNSRIYTADELLAELERRVDSLEAPAALDTTSPAFRRAVAAIAKGEIDEALGATSFEERVGEIVSEWGETDEGETRIKDLIESALSDKDYVENDELEGKLADLLENEITLRVTVER